MKNASRVFLVMFALWVVNSAIAVVVHSFMTEVSVPSFVGGVSTTLLILGIILWAAITAEDEQS